MNYRSLVFALALAACGGSKGAAFPTVSELPTLPRQPDGVVVDPESERPAPKESASSDSGTTTLRAPLHPEAARELARAFFHAVSREDLPHLALLLTENATFAAPSGGSTASVLDVYRARAQRFDYFPLMKARIFDEESVEIYRFEDFDVTWKLPISRPEAMEATDLTLRVPIRTTHSSAGRLFGDELLLVIRQGTEGAKIRAVVEEFLGW